jgi:hypothetical protein
MGPDGALVYAWNCLVVTSSRIIVPRYVKLELIPTASLNCWDEVLALFFWFSDPAWGEKRGVRRVKMHLRECGDVAKGEDRLEEANSKWQRATGGEWRVGRK